MGNVKFVTHRQQVQDAMQRGKDRALEIIGGKAESYAKQIVPVDTGHLRNSITHQQYDDDTEVIGSNVEYAPYVELGTYKMRARPYLRPAAENHTREYKEIVIAEMNKEMR